MGVCKNFHNSSKHVKENFASKCIMLKSFYNRPALELFYKRGECNCRLQLQISCCHLPCSLSGEASKPYLYSMQVKMSQ